MSTVDSTNELALKSVFFVVLLFCCSLTRWQNRYAFNTQPIAHDHEDGSWLILDFSNQLIKLLIISIRHACKPR